MEENTINNNGCPNCGSTNITFKREKASEQRRKSVMNVIYKTIGMCRDCGCTWTVVTKPTKRAGNTGGARNFWRVFLWILGWIYIFPLPTTILLSRKKEMKPILKYGIIAIVWIVYLIIGFSYSVIK